MGIKLRRLTQVYIFMRKTIYRAEDLGGYIQF